MEHAEKITFICGWSPLWADPHRHRAPFGIAQQVLGCYGQVAAIRRKSLSDNSFGFCNLTDDFDV